MKCAVMLLLTCTRLLLAGWEYVELPSEIEYINQDIVQGLSSYYIWVVAYDNENSEALILRSYWGWPSWERYTTPFDQDYVYTDIVGDWVVPNPHAIVVGYKKGEPEKHKGIILRGNGAGFDDITCNVPDSLPCRQSPTPFLSVARYPDAPLDDKVIVTGGFGTILISNDNGDTWSYVASHPNADPEARLSDWYYSSDWSAAYYPRPFVVCGDNTGLVAWTYDDGVNWHAKDFPYSEGYQIPGLQNPYAGNLTPLHVQDSACGMSFGYVAVGIPDWRSGQISFDNTGTPQKWWWWHGAACWRYGLPWETTYAHWFVGADGGILRCDSAIFDVPHCKWEHQPENDSFYTLNTIDFGVTDDLYSWYFHGHALGSKGRNLYAQFGFLPPGNVDYPPAPNVQAAPRRPQNFTMVYDAIYGGYRMYWDPPANHDSAKVGGYWICPPEDDGEIGFIANKVPIPRTTYFLSWPIGSYLIAGACPMRRDGLSGDWSNFEWRCTIDKLVDDGATGRNNAGRLLYGGSTAWSFWSKDGEIHVACSADSGKHWTYRPAQAALGSGYWPAAALDNNHNPAVCWVENIVNGSQVTARIHYCRHDGREWSSSYIIREETFTGAGYLYPSVSVSENNHVHIIYGKVYDDYQNWQLWYGEFPLDDPDAVEWYALDYQSGRPEALGKLVPTIGTDRYSQPMVVWNRPNSDALYFAYRDGQGAWHTRTLGFTGTSPCLEVKGVTAYL
ncbi:hypothetical protein IBX73_07140, partial [candidate division WOR-3 bacterium]|nr:hypothetical protein [candidate division WOR-3 bacterium]